MKVNFKPEFKNYIPLSNRYLDVVRPINNLYPYRGDLSKYLENYRFRSIKIKLKDKNILIDNGIITRNDSVIDIMGMVCMMKPEVIGDHIYFNRKDVRVLLVDEYIKDNDKKNLGKRIIKDAKNSKIPIIVVSREYIMSTFLQKNVSLDELISNSGTLREKACRKQAIIEDIVKALNGESVIDIWEPNQIWYE